MGNSEAQKLLAQAVQSGKAQSKQASAMFSKMTKALDGNITQEQEKLREEERHQKKPGQVLSIAESEREMEKAMAMAHADMERIKEAKAASAKGERSSEEQSASSAPAS